MKDPSSGLGHLLRCDFIVCTLTQTSGLYIQWCWDLIPFFLCRLVDKDWCSIWNTSCFMVQTWMFRMPAETQHCMSVHYIIEWVTKITMINNASNYGRFLHAIFLLNWKILETNCCEDVSNRCRWFEGLLQLENKGRGNCHSVSVMLQMMLRLKLTLSITVRSRILTNQLITRGNNCGKSSNKYVFLAKLHTPQNFRIKWIFLPWSCSVNIPF